MPQDMSQFLQVFFEETEEHLATLELLLIGLDLDRPDSETLHGIFRAAHSIKGSSGMFGFDDITAVTHELETLLDRIRCGQMGLRPDMISSFLEARDVLQRLLDAHRSGRPDPGVPLLETVERQAVQVVHRFPEFVGRDLHLFDQLRRVVEDAPHQGLGARIAAFVELAAGLFEEALDVGSLGNLHGHGVCLCLLLSGVGRESQRSSAWIDEGCRQSPSISMSM